jgi:hypothetical protein
VRRELVFKAGRQKDQGPQPVNVNETLGTEYCGFPVRYEASGKMKTRHLPNGDTLSLFQYPGLRVTLTNKKTGKQETYVSTGTIRATDLKGGETLLVTTGQTVLHSPTIGILVVNGRFTVVEDKKGNFSQPEGNGSIINICDQLA